MLASMVPSETGLEKAYARALPDKANELLGCFIAAVSREGGTTVPD